METMRSSFSLGQRELGVSSPPLQREAGESTTGSWDQSEVTEILHLPGGSDIPKPEKR